MIALSETRFCRAGMHPVATTNINSTTLPIGRQVVCSAFIERLSQSDQTGVKTLGRPMYSPILVRGSTGAPAPGGVESRAMGQRLTRGAPAEQPPTTAPALPARGGTPLPRRPRSVHPWGTTAPHRPESTAGAGAQDC